MEELEWTVEQFKAWFYETFDFSTKVHHGIFGQTELGQEYADELRKATQALDAKVKQLQKVCVACGRAGAAGNDQAMENGDDDNAKQDLADFESKQAVLATQARCS